MSRVWCGGLLLWAGILGAQVRFAEVAQEAGIRFKHEKGSQGMRYMPETYGSGVAFLDCDKDGMLDLYFVNGGRLPGLSTAPLARNALYRNQGDGTFAEITQASGAGDTGYGMGVAVGDFDNDGDADLYLTNFGPNRLYRNEGQGRFSDFTAQAGVGGRGWSSSAAFADADLDGELDLYVCTYLDYPAKDPLACLVGNSSERLYCDPRKFSGLADRFYHNQGEGRFADWTEKMGLANARGKELGVVFGDLDLDGDPDLYLANDMAPNALYRNEGTRFVERGLASGASLSLEGKVQAGMGVDLGDYDNDGRPDLWVTNFQWESNSLYRNLGNGFFADMAVESGIHQISFPYLGFGTGFLDADGDGDLDLFVANGHVYDNVEKIDPAASYAQRSQLLLNQGTGRFVEAVDAGPGLAPARVSRGAAFGDYDNDGDTDIALNNSGDLAALLRNERGNHQHWLGIRLKGRQSNRDGVGAQVRVKVGGQVQWRQVRGGGSYLSAHDLRLLFGLDTCSAIEQVEVRWSNGRLQQLGVVKVDQYLMVEEE